MQKADAPEMPVHWSVFEGVPQKRKVRLPPNHGHSRRRRPPLRPRSSHVFPPLSGYSSVDDTPTIPQAINVRDRSYATARSILEGD